jgi:hypothetical protein
LVRELVVIFAERDRGGAPCHRVRAMAREKLAAVEQSLRDLQIWRRELSGTRRLGSSSQKHFARTACRIAGTLCCFSPDPSEALFNTCAPGARTARKEEITMRAYFAILIFAVAVLVARGQEPSPAQNERSKDPHADCPMHQSHAHDESATPAVTARGAQGMGFSQTATAHHFLLKANGGAILVEANDTADTVSRDNIRMHLSHIAKAFANGDFTIPMFVHDTVPPGISVMKEMSGKITYK